MAPHAAKVFLLVLVLIAPGWGQEHQWVVRWVTFEDGSRFPLPQGMTSMQWLKTDQDEAFLRINLLVERGAWLMVFPTKGKSAEKMGTKALAETLFVASGLFVQGWRPLELGPDNDDYFYCTINQKPYVASYKERATPIGVTCFLMVVPEAKFEEMAEILDRVSNGFDPGPPVYPTHDAVTWWSVVLVCLAILICLFTVRVCLKWLAQIPSTEVDL